MIKNSFTDNYAPTPMCGAPRLKDFQQQSEQAGDEARADLEGPGDGAAPEPSPRRRASCWRKAQSGGGAEPGPR